MKSAILGMMAVVGGMILIIGILTMFEYVSVHNTLSFALKNGIFQSSKIAMIPDIVCELVENPDYVALPQGVINEIPEFIEVCEEIYPTLEEYFAMLYDQVASYHQSAVSTKLELLAFQPKPYVAKARLTSVLNSAFWRTTIAVEEMVISH